jgi:hypothetical protein
MIRLGNSIRLTVREVERLTEITSITPVNVNSLESLDAYINRCLLHFWGVSTDTRFMHWLINQEHARCLGS